VRPLTWADVEAQQLGTTSASQIKDVARRMAGVLEASKTPHYHCDDSWFCCRMCEHPDHGGSWAAGDCTCGAEAHNARIDEILGDSGEK
jgi:hypothetical protein